MAEILKMPQGQSFDPQLSFNDLVISIANQIAEATLEAVKERDTSVWLSQQELMKHLNCSWEYVKQIEKYGLQSRKQGKYEMYCLADVYEALHLMKN
ncbi:hypothetical protein [Streptococcus ovis]|uniref:hypothetical protein n=1 Tax=Streptococcus ovis TaxID=82806 RepID=UPI00038200C1|nr:hypothetical protein [Streptococcus ovis]